MEEKVSDSKSKLGLKSKEIKMPFPTKGSHKLDIKTGVSTFGGGSAG